MECFLQTAESQTIGTVKGSKTQDPRQDPRQEWSVLMRLGYTGGVLDANPLY
jgi:hypothetical protein